MVSYTNSDLKINIVFLFHIVSFFSRISLSIKPAEPSLWLATSFPLQHPNHIDQSGKRMWQCSSSSSTLGGLCTSTEWIMPPNQLICRVTQQTQKGCWTKVCFGVAKRSHKSDKALRHSSPAVASPMLIWPQHRTQYYSRKIMSIDLLWKQKGQLFVIL